MNAIFGSKTYIVYTYNTNAAARRGVARARTCVCGIYRVLYAREYASFPSTRCAMRARRV